MISGIHISSGSFEVQKDHTRKNLMPALKNDQVIDARVLKQMPQGKVQLLINGHTLTAKTSLLLNTGEMISLKVQKENDSVILKLIAPEREMSAGQLSSLISLMSRDKIFNDLGGLPIKSLKTLLHDMALKSGKTDARILSKFLASGGLMWEKKLASVLQTSNFDTLKQELSALLKQDIKGTALYLLGSAGSGSLDAMTVLTEFSETIEKFQLLNHQTSESGRYLLPFPIFAGESFSFGQLLIDTGDSSDEDREDSKKVINVSLLLNMSQLGPVRADFSIYKNALSGRFKLKDQATCDHIESMVPELKNRLVRNNYQVHQIYCQVATPDEIDKRSLVETILTRNPTGLLNIVI